MSTNPYCSSLFVTWKKSQGNNLALRGCIGTLEPRQIHSALKDYALTRFGTCARSQLSIYSSRSLIVNFWRYHPTFWGLTSKFPPQPCSMCTFGLSLTETDTPQRMQSFPVLSGINASSQYLKQKSLFFTARFRSSTVLRLRRAGWTGTLGFMAS